MNDASQPGVPAGATSPEKVHGRVLVVDDESLNRAVLRKLLVAQGCEVIEAASGEDGIELARRQSPDLALVDVMMPGMTGYEVCKRMRGDAATGTIPVILVTARREVEDVEHGFDLGAFDYIRKPFNPRELMARVRNALALKHSSDKMRLWREQMTRELELAGSLQRKLFPAHPLFTRDFEISVAYRPTLTVGGDVFDVINLPGGGLCVYVGDVSGHGVGPALVSTLLKAIVAEVVRELASAGPAAVSREIDVRFRRHVSNPSMYTTLFLAIYNPARSVWTCMNCGHPAPLLILPDGRDLSSPLDSGGDVPIGFAIPSPSGYAVSGETEAPAPPGSVLILFTDGLLDARHHATEQPCGMEGLRGMILHEIREPLCVSPAGRLLSAMSAAGYELDRDDVSVLMVRHKVSSELRIECDLAVDVVAVSETAARAEQALTADGWPDEEAMKVRLAIMEHGTNIARHGRAKPGSVIRFAMWIRGRLCLVLVRDRGREWDHAAALAAVRDEPLDRECKRGLALIEAISVDSAFFRYGEENNTYLAFVRDSGTMGPSQ
jgi:phosphoserine phosphatase RsbU/P